MLLATIACAVALAGCGGDKPATVADPTVAPTTETTATATASARVDRFDEDRAWSLLTHQVKLGPRPAGSPAAKTLAGYIRRRLPHGRFERVPGGLTNVVGEIKGKGKPTVVAAHYDTKDLPGFVGANDGAGGTAEML